MNVVLSKSNIRGKVEIPPSKSLAHRVMIASFLAGGNFDFELSGDDVVATRNCLFELQKLFDGEVDVAVLSAGESGSTLRFLLPIVCALDVNARFLGHGRLPERPIGELVDVLRVHGANILGEKLPIDVLSSGSESCLANGGLQSGEYVVNAGVSSQYITGLLFALPLLQGDSRIVLDGALVSKDYVDLTIFTLEKFGVEIQKTDYGFFVKGNQKYFVPTKVEIEGDWSSAAFPLALGLLSGEVEVCGLDEHSKQADRAFFDIARAMGGDIRFERCVCLARKSNLSGIRFDASNCPDIVPILAVLAGFASGDSEIVGVDRLKAKESDRLLATINLLEKIGIESEYKNNALKIAGNGLANAKSAEQMKPNAEVVIDSFDDHRIAMSGIVAGLFVGCVEVDRVECISKSYPNFLQDVLLLGGQFEQTEGEKDEI